MRQPVRQDSVESGITQYDLDHALGGGILAKDRVDLFFDRPEHLDTRMVAPPALERAASSRVPHGDADCYQTRQGFSRTMGWPTLQAKAVANSGMLAATPLMRYSGGECGSVMACTRLLSARSSPQAHCAKPIKNRCSGVKPSMAVSFWSQVASFQAI